jgi:hypothetical protein
MTTAKAVHHQLNSRVGQFPRRVRGSGGALFHSPMLFYDKAHRLRRGVSAQGRPVRIRNQVVRVATAPRSLVVVLEFLVVTLGPSLPCRRVSTDTALVRPGVSMDMIVACRAVLMEKSRLSASRERCGSRRRGRCREMAGHLLRPSLSDSLPYPQTPLIQTCCDKHPRRCESFCCWGTMP